MCFRLKAIYEEGGEEEIKMEDVSFDSEVWSPQLLQGLHVRAESVHDHSHYEY